METTQHDAAIIHEDRRKQAEAMQGRLQLLGIQVNIQHFTGDSSFPTEYRLRYGIVEAIGPTMDMALVEFVKKLLRSEKADAFQAMETALQVLSGTIMNLRAELLVVKGLVAAKSEQDQEYEDSRKYIEHHYLGGE